MENNLERGTASFVGLMREEIRVKTLARRYGTAANLRSALRSFSAFLGGRDLSIGELTVGVVESYAAHLAGRGVARNTVSFYMRGLRSVHNKAVRRGLAAQSEPFRDVYTGVDKTRKRAVDEQTVRQLYRLDLPDGPLRMARDMFIFSYCARSMSFVDIAYLRKSDVADGYVCYVRRKTGQQMRVRQDIHMRRIIDRYAAADSVYVFPIDRDLTDAEAEYRSYRRAINEYNRRLRILSARLPGRPSLTSYTARHSWATIAYRLHSTPVAVVSAGLGHTTETTTRIYLESLDSSVVDEANELVTAGLDD